MSRSMGEHVRCPEGTIINGRFKVVREVGCGNFAKVYKCSDVQHPNATPVAVKILKREYAADAAFEADILKALGARDKHGHKVVRMLDQFTWSRCPCFVFALRGASLRSRKFGVARGHVGTEDLRKFVKEMTTTLAFLHQDVRMVHTDLKPENILIDDEHLPSGSSGIGTGWTIADFGSASFYNPAKPDSDLISTRPYRAPEVVLGMPWSTKADVFSMACIIFEVYYGARLFEASEDGEHLALFEKRLAKLPLSFTRQSKHFRRYFDSNGNLMRSAHVGYMSARGGATGSSSVGARHLSEIVQDSELRDMLTQMLEVDPNRRCSAQDCMRHPFLAGGRAAVSPLRSQLERMAINQQQPASLPSSQPASRSSSVAAYPPHDKENPSAAYSKTKPQSSKISPAVPAVALASAADRYHYAMPTSSRAAAPTSSRAAAAPLGSARLNDMQSGRAQAPLMRDLPAAGRPSSYARPSYW